MRSAYTILAFVLCLTIPEFSNGQSYLFPAKKGGLWGFIDNNSKWVIEPSYLKVHKFSEGKAAVQSYAKWGYLDKDGEWIITPRFEEAMPFSEGLAAVVFENRWGFVNESGEFVIKPQYHKVSSFSEGLAVVSVGTGYYFINHEGLPANDISFQAALPFAEGKAPIMKDGKFAFVDNSGRIAIRHPYIEASPFSEGLSQISDQSGWGFMDHSGGLAIPMVFSSTTHFSNGLAAVKKENQWGYIDKIGSWVIDEKFDKASPFSYGFAVVVENDKYGVINEAGEWIIKPKFQELKSAGRSVSLKQELKNLIQEHYNNWALKGEFEKTEKYLARTTDSRKALAMDSIADRVISEYGRAVTDLTRAELGYYNADLEEFSLFIPGTYPTTLNVPIEEALWFKENYRKGEFIDVHYLLAGENLVLSDYSFTVGSRVYDYKLSSEENSLYSYATLNWNQEILVPEITWEAKTRDTNNDVVVAAAPGTSDVDRNIPKTEFLNKNTFALIIGNEDYSSFQAAIDTEVDVSFAAIDAEMFAKYANLTLGIPQENITLILNGTAGQISQGLSKMNKIAEAYNGEAEFIFYYAGHGLPDDLTGRPYLIPVDVTGADLSFAIGLDDALNQLTEHPHKRVTVFLDACFTGGARNTSLVSSRGVKIRPKSAFIKGNLAMFSASSATESAYAYKQKAHGMFTYYLLKALQSSEGNISYTELADYLEESVVKSSLVYNSKEQTPSLMVSPALEGKWEGFRLNRSLSMILSSKAQRP